MESGLRRIPCGIIARAFRSLITVGPIRAFRRRKIWNSFIPERWSCGTTALFTIGPMTGSTARIFRNGARIIFCGLNRITSLVRATNISEHGGPVSYTHLVFRLRSRFRVSLPAGRRVPSSRNAREHAAGGCRCRRAVPAGGELRVVFSWSVYFGSVCFGCFRVRFRVQSPGRFPGTVRAPPAPAPAPCRANL